MSLALLLVLFWASCLVLWVRDRHRAHRRARARYARELAEYHRDLEAYRAELAAEEGR